MKYKDFCCYLHILTSCNYAGEFLKIKKAVLSTLQNAIWTYEYKLNTCVI